MPEYTAEMAHAAAARGAAWLDEHCPDWVRKIDTRYLDLQSPILCMLGQTEPCLVPNDFTGRSVYERGYWRVLDFLGYGPYSDWPKDHGFSVPARSDSPRQYEMLTIAWKELIWRRVEVAA